MVKVEFFIAFDFFFKGVNQFLDKEIFVYGFLLNSVFVHLLKKNLMGSIALRNVKKKANKQMIF